MTKCKKCKCPAKIDIQICVPEGVEIGAVEIFQVAGGKPTGEFKPGRVEEDDWDSDEDDEDYVPGIDSEDDPYEELPFSEKEKQELRDELLNLILEAAENDESEED